MACCGGQVSWYHCYPEPCPSNDGCCCDDPCAGCTTCGTCPCSGCTPKCGRGKCCTCNQEEFGFAWVSSPASCNLEISCGQQIWFTSESPIPCGTCVSGTRRDYNGNSMRLADLSPALFTALGHDPLREGVFDAIASTTSCTGCPC